MKIGLTTLIIRFILTYEVRSKYPKGNIVKDLFIDKHALRRIIIIIAIFCTPIVSSSQDFEIIGSCELPSSVTGIDVSGSYAYITGRNMRLMIVDISDPFAPEVVSYADTVGKGADIAVAGHYAYVSRYNSETNLKIFDISDPLNPAVVGVYYSSGYGHHITVRKNTVYFANCSRGLKLIDVTNPLLPSLISVYDSLDWGEAYGILVVNQYAYLTEWNGGLYILDISDPTVPTLIGHCWTGLHSSGICIKDDFAYIANIDIGVSIVDVSDLSNPNLVTTYDSIYHCKNLQIQENYLFVANDHLTVLDISNPTNPFSIAELELNPPNDVYVRGDYIYITNIRTFYVLRFAVTNIHNEGTEILSEFQILQNHPNPFNAATTISYSLPEQGEVVISIYNLLGQLVDTVFEGTRDAGEHTVTWDASDHPSGVYFARLKTGERTENIKMVLLK